MTAALPLLLQGIMAAISAAPQVADIVTKAKDFFAMLFAKGLIDRAQQDALFHSIDAHCELVNAGIIEREFQVDPDPAKPAR